MINNLGNIVRKIITYYNENTDSISEKTYLHYHLSPWILYLVQFQDL